MARLLRLNRTSRRPRSGSLYRRGRPSRSNRGGPQRNPALLLRLKKSPLRSRESSKSLSAPLRRTSGPARSCVTTGFGLNLKPGALRHLKKQRKSAILLPAIRSLARPDRPQVPRLNKLSHPVPAKLPARQARPALLARRPLEAPGGAMALSEHHSGMPTGPASCSGLCPGIQSLRVAGGGRVWCCCALPSALGESFGTWRSSRAVARALMRPLWPRSRPLSTPRPCGGGGAWSVRPCCPSVSPSKEVDHL